MAYGKIENGILVSANTQIDNTFQPLSNFASVDAVTKEVSYSKYYNQDGTPDTVRILAEVETTRIHKIKTKAGELINSLYPIYKQLNAPRGTLGSEAMYSDIDRIRTISNTAEIAGTLFKDVVW